MSETLPAIVARLARAGWGDLPLGHKAVLSGLAIVLDPHAGAGTVTAWQIAQASGRSERRTRDVLHALEAEGFITWARGWLDKGRPRPGWVRVSKTKLWALIRPARRAADAARAQRANALTRRIRETLRLATQRPRRAPQPQNPLSSRPEISSTLTPSGVTTNGGAYAPAPSTSPGKDTCMDNLNPRRWQAPTPHTPLPTFYDKGRFGPIVVNPNECGICHGAPHPPSAHHAFEAAHAKPSRMPASWPMPTGQDGLL